MSGADYTYESQNDQRLDELHSKIRTLRHVTIDINNDSQRQNLMLDDTGNSFTSFGAGLMSSSRQASRAFGLNGGVKQWRIIGYCCAAFFGLYFLWKLSGLWWWFNPATDVPAIPSQGLI
ncbi:hypothetical protein FRB93_000840 [Tulasnella sp. JGI-2019a]|nr:hypothetical protein FRB93_000840 [Tulasnella sp. JGI-2019a]